MNAPPRPPLPPAIPPREMPPALIAARRALKQALEPDNILNPGKIFPFDA